MGFDRPGNVIDITDLAFASLTATFSENSAGTSGQLKLSDGVHSATLNFAGALAPAGFHGSAAAAGFTTAFDGTAGVDIAYHTLF